MRLRLWRLSVTSCCRIHLYGKFPVRAASRGAHAAGAATSLGHPAETTTLRAASAGRRGDAEAIDQSAMSSGQHLFSVGGQLTPLIREGLSTA